ncbi:MAG: hypothetical protein QOJ64_2509 [Acidobacteriota bacterium]|jgi:prolyl 4-hydroxylase|nr:hypothetical protein [Acidobacteriota bacterium]
MSAYTEEIPGILAVEIFDAVQCRTIAEYVRLSQSWAEAKVSAPSAAGFNAATRLEARRASVLAPTRESDARRVFDEKMESIIKPVVKDAWGVGLREHKDTHFVRYATGNYYRPHSDTGTNRADRYFTVICYLNADFEGGNTSFPQLKYSITPRPGKAVVFPATYLHCAEPVTKGEKYVLVSWLTGAPPIRWL